VCLAKYPHRIRPNRISVYRKSVNKQTKEGQFRWMEVNQKGSRIMSEAVRAWRIWPRAASELLIKSTGLARADVRRRVASRGQQRAPPDHRSSLNGPTSNSIAGRVQDTVTGGGAVGG
jgi:hypothetical protein